MMAQDVVFKGDSVVINDSITISRELYEEAMSIAEEAVHLSFMGINFKTPTDEFCKALEEKGCSQIYLTDPKDMKIFKGLFYGKDATIYITHSPSIKKVINATAYIELENKKEVQDLMEELKEQLENKYEVKAIAKDNSSGLKEYQFNIGMNMILVGQFYPKVDDGIHYECLLMYSDVINAKLAHQSKIDDL